MRPIYGEIVETHILAKESILSIIPYSTFKEETNQENVR